MIAENPARPFLRLLKPELQEAVRLLRLKQWTKNLIVFVPLLFAARVHELQLLGKACCAFFAFCLLSAAIYIVNDIIDRHRDKLHPLKCLGAIAAERISAKIAVALAVCCALSGLVLSFTASVSCGLVALAYVALMLLYNYLLKQYVLLDVLAIAGGFVLRAVAGAAAVSVPVSGWFLLCTSFGAVFLALEKRRQEIYVLKEDAVNHRGSLINYSPEILDSLQRIVVPGALLCYLLYCIYSYHGKAMLITFPLVVLGIGRYQYLSKNQRQGILPEDVLLTDRMIQATLVLWLLCSALIVYIH